MAESVYDRLKAIVGANRVSTSPKTLEKYSKDQSFVRPCTPDCVVYAETVAEVQEVVKAANAAKVPVVPVSSGMNLRGAAIPKAGGIILDLSRMNKIGEIRDLERWAVIEPGVTYGQLSAELEKHNLRIMPPLGVPQSRSVLSCICEGDPALAAASFDYGNSLFMDRERVLPSGELMRLGLWETTFKGKWSMTGGGGIIGENNAYDWLWQATQGTVGVITKIVVKAEHLLPKHSKVFVLPFDSLPAAIEPLRRIQRKEMGLECFLLNNFNLSAIRAEDWAIPDKFPCAKVASDGFNARRARLPKWTLVIHIAPLPYFPEEKVALESEALRSLCQEMSLSLARTVGGEEGLDSTLLDLILHPWLALKKANFKGSFHPVTFYTILRRAPEFETTIKTLAQKHGYPVEDIGGYVLPIEKGRNCYLEFDFHCDLNDPDDVERVKRLWLEANETCANMGAVLSNPYGPRADMIYRRVDPTYVAIMKDWKKALDPNNVLNPGQLCF